MVEQNNMLRPARVKKRKLMRFTTLFSSSKRLRIVYLSNIHVVLHIQLHA